ncbi:MAG: glycosyltransferase family 2 protein [Deltaproteobacteria bacterium]|nr:glycosyltransferase family 2 protein [Deltaproteobacteria bacterium]
MKTKMPLFDVVIPAHNASPSIRAAVKSALDQGPSLAQVIVVADRCDDDTAQKAQSAGAHQVHSATFGNAGAARNLAAAKGSATWIAFLDADDRFLPGWLKKASEVISRADDDVAMVFGGAVFCRGDLRTLSVPMPEAGDVYEALLTQSFFTTSATLIRRDIFEKAEGFNTSVCGAVLEDYELFTRVLAKYSANFVKGHHVEYVMDNESATRSPRHFKKLRERGLEILRAALERRTLSRPAIQRAYAQMHRMSAERFLASSLVDEARHDLQLALKQTPGDLRLWSMAALSILKPSERNTLLHWRRRWRRR